MEADILTATPEAAAVAMEAVIDGSVPVEAEELPLPPPPPVEDTPPEEADKPADSGAQGDMEGRVLELERKLADKEHNCLLLEQQLVQANQQVETCYYELEENRDLIRKYGAEVAGLRSELERSDVALKSARMESDRVRLVESERRKLSEMVAALNDELHDKSKKLEDAMAVAGDFEKRLSETMSEATSLQKTVESVESECEAHKKKASDIYALYQQLQEENIGLVKQLKERSDSVSAATASEGPTPRYHELNAEVERLSRKCRDMDDVLISKDGEIQELQQQIASLVSESKVASSSPTPTPPTVTNTGNSVAEAEMIRLENEIRMLKLSNAGLVSENASLKGQIANKNTRIDHLNCEVLSMRQSSSVGTGIGTGTGTTNVTTTTTATAKTKGDLDLEAYLHRRRSGMTANDSSRKIHEVRSFKEVFQIAAEDAHCRRCCIAYLVILHICFLFSALR